MGKLWSIDIFEQPLDPFHVLLKKPIAKLNSKKIRINRKHVHTYADPFILTYGNKLYLFAEIQEIQGKGYINLWESEDAKEWKDLGVVLKGESHYSYPFIFHDDTKNEYYLIPESNENEEVAIYSFENFPFCVRKKTTLLKGSFADSNIIQLGGVYFLSTTNLKTGNLELYLSIDLFSNKWKIHPASPITSDKLIYRNGGGFIKLNNKIFRIAQNCSEVYGGGIIILEVQILDSKNYQEAIIYSDVNERKESNKIRHHLSVTRFCDRTIIASDFQQFDYWVNKISSGFYKLVEK